MLILSESNDLPQIPSLCVEVPLNYPDSGVTLVNDMSDYCKLLS